ncbi:MAG: hypothetical protein KGI41_00525 [Patescibacteria group bacterium]|nr:hypothetical protein [Patescibacteria group bacterium]MDE1965714.1 hypothetical protein [Patescibacteria group bacterium]
MPAKPLLLIESDVECSVRAISPGSVYAAITLILLELAAMMGVYAGALQIWGALDNLTRYERHFHSYPPSEVYYLLAHLGLFSLCFALAMYLPARLVRLGRRTYRVHCRTTEGFEI